MRRFWAVLFNFGRIRRRYAPKTHLVSRSLGRYGTLLKGCIRNPPARRIRLTFVPFFRVVPAPPFSFKSCIAGFTHPSSSVLNKSDGKAHIPVDMWLTVLWLAVLYMLREGITVKGVRLCV